MEYKEVAHKAGIVQYERAESLNDSPLFADALAALAAEHLQSGRVSSDEYRLNCPHCTNPTQQAERGREGGWGGEGEVVSTPSGAAHGCQRVV